MQSSINITVSKTQTHIVMNMSTYRNGKMIIKCRI